MWNHLPWLVLVSVFLTSSSTAADGQIRLTGSGSTLCSGRVEIYHNDNWGTVCDDSWDLNDARVVCRQVGCGTALEAPQSAHFGQGTGQIWLDDVACSGSERSLTQCGHLGFGTHNCKHSEDAGVVCSHVRLVGLNRCAGRTEIRYSSTWGTVCDDEWDMEDAKVVCAELDCGTALKAPHSAHFGQGSGQIWLDNVACSGSERSLIDCGHLGFGTNNCEHSEDAGVVCSDGQKPSISMNPSGEVTWGQTVTITCSASGDQLNGTFIFTKTSGSFSQRLTSNSSSATLNIPQVDFENEGSFQCRFQRLSNQDFSTPLSDSVRLSVTVPLQQPNIALTSPNGGLVWGHKGAEITKGYSFVITCIISTLHSNGVFSLIFDANITHSKPAVNNSAVFSFPVAEYEHQGNYSCIYEVTLSSRKFNSGETAPISITITFPLMLLIISLVSGTLPLVLLVLVLVWLVHRKRQAKQPGANIQTQRAVGHIDGGCEDKEEQQVYMNLEPVCNTKRQKKKGRQMEEKRSAHHKGRIIEGSNGQEMVYEECFAANKEAKNETSSDTEGDYIDLNEPSSEDYLDIYVEVEDNNEQEAVYEDTTAINETIENQTRNDKDYRLNYGKVQQSLPEGDLDIYGEEEDIYENF